MGRGFQGGKIDLLVCLQHAAHRLRRPASEKALPRPRHQGHNLLQALTRVNRTYQNFRYGYVVDFADIRKEFDATNKAYFDELQAELGDEMEHYSNLFKVAEEIARKSRPYQGRLFPFDIENAEVFSQQISQIQDRADCAGARKRHWPMRAASTI